ncbi:MAG: protein kinase [Chloroflexi bacterium]|nr:protein kinase [Chloroflexota bacterium]
MDDLVGKQIGQYLVQERIGDGGMATVYRGLQESIGREVAIKVIDSKLASQDPAWLDRFYREVQIAAQLPHPHIVPIYDYGEFDGLPYTVMALLEGGTLADYIQEHGPLSIEDTIELLRPLTSALDFAHEEGIVHRDLKPANILFDRQGNLYLGDFGLARSNDSTRLTASGSAMGTPAYMAPDWQQGDLTAAADIYSLGVCIYEMLAGQVPYDGGNVMQVIMAHVNEAVPDIRSVRSDLPEGVHWVIAAAMAKAPDRRYTDARTLLGDLEMLLTDPNQASAVAQREPQETYHYPNGWMRSILQAAEDTLGTDQLQSVLVQAGLAHYVDEFPPQNNRKAIPFEEVSALLYTIYGIYGSRGARSVGRWAGRRSHYRGLADYKAMAKMSQALMARAPDDETRVRIGLTVFAKFYNNRSDQRVEFDETDDHYVWRILRCPVCWMKQANEPLGFLVLGVLEGALEWATGQTYRMVEHQCIAQGDPYGEFLIDKTPLEETE